MRYGGYISVLHRYALHYFNSYEAQTGVRGVQYPYLVYICRHEGCRQEELAEHLHINKSNVTRQLEKMQKSGLVDIRPDQNDGRGRCVYPTEKGRQSREKIRKVQAGWNDIMCGTLDEQEREQLMALLMKSLEAVKEWDSKK